MAYTFDTFRADLAAALTNADLSAIIANIQSDMAGNPTAYGAIQVAAVNNWLNQFDNAKPFQSNFYIVGMGGAFFCNFGNLNPPSPAPPLTGYLVMTGKISQSGTADPVLTLFDNTIGTYACFRASAGLYKIEIGSAGFPTTTWCVMQGVEPDLGIISTMKQVGGAIEITTEMLSAQTTTGIIAGAIDDYSILDGQSFEIRIY